jgi:ATP-dependent DNA helicase MPH1
LLLYLITANVIDKLLIAHIELRSDESIDVQQYNHSRQINKFVLKLSDDIIKMKDTFSNVNKI